jgi:hypothetical protein
MIRRLRNTQRNMADPSPGEIRRRTEAIRKTWSATELSRRSSFRPIAWMPPLLASSDFPEVPEADSGATF